jgi:hypothetical protein
MSKAFEERFNELEKAYNDSVNEQQRMQALMDETEAMLRQLALKHYPEIENLEKEGFEKLVSSIARHADRFVIDVNEICNEMQIK